MASQQQPSAWLVTRRLNKLFVTLMPPGPKLREAKTSTKLSPINSADATVLPPNASAATTKEAIRKVWQDLLASPGLAISWKATKVEVAKSGDLGFISGTYELTMNDAGGKPVTDKGKYVEVWEKKDDGKWKCGTDTWNSDLPAASSSPAPGAEERK